MSSTTWSSSESCLHKIKCKKNSILYAVPNAVWPDVQKQVRTLANGRSQTLLEERSLNGYEEISLEALLKKSLVSNSAVKKFSRIE